VQVGRFLWTRVCGPRTPALSVRPDFGEIRVGVVSSVVQFLGGIGLLVGHRSAKFYEQNAKREQLSRLYIFDDLLYSLSRTQQTNLISLIESFTVMDRLRAYQKTPALIEPFQRATGRRLNVSLLNSGRQKITSITSALIMNVCVHRANRLTEVLQVRS